MASLNFTSPNTAGGEIGINGNDPANQSLHNGVLTGLNWAPGQSLVLRWDNIDLSGQDNGLAIDNFTATGIIPSPGALALLGWAGIVGGRRRRRSA